MAINILLVEDVPIAQKLASIMLTELGHTVVVAGNGYQALELFKKNHFDLVLMDLGLPDIDGITLTETLRTMENNNKHIPIVALTAHAGEHEKENCLNAGMDNYRVKPLTEELCREILDKFI